MCLENPKKVKDGKELTKICYTLVRVDEDGKIWPLIVHQPRPFILGRWYTAINRPSRNEEAIASGPGYSNGLNIPLEYEPAFHVFHALASAHHMGCYLNARHPKTRVAKVEVKHLVAKGEANGCAASAWKKRRIIELLKHPLDYCPKNVDKGEK